jgi:uncharacterized membrane protein YbhN (UPF0104 family)
VLSLLAFGPAPLLIAVRLKWLLAVHNVSLSVWDAIKVTFAGNFISNALPLGTSGGDAVKAFYIARNTPHKHEAVITVFFDRVIGVVSLLLMSGIVVLINWRRPEFATYGRTIGLMVLVLAAGAAVYYSNRIRRWLWIEDIINLLPLAHHWRRLDKAVFAFRHRFKRVAASIVLTMLLQLVSIFSLFLAGWALGLVHDREQPWESLPVYLGYMPICFLAGALPLGVMETLYAELFSRAAKLGPEEAAVFLSIFSRLVQLAWGLPGSIVVLQSGRPPANEAAALSEAAEEQSSVN